MAVNNACCRSLEQAVHQSAIPVTFDVELSEYQLELATGGYALIHYCPFCGHRFPDSTRHLLHVQPSDEDLSEIEVLLSVAGIRGLCSRLGEPAETIDVGRTKQHRFTNWRTVDLVVLEDEDGSLEFTAVPKQVVGDNRGDAADGHD